MWKANYSSKKRSWEGRLSTSIASFEATKQPSDCSLELRTPLFATPRFATDSWVYFLSVVAGFPELGRALIVPGHQVIALDVPAAIHAAVRCSYQKWTVELQVQRSWPRQMQPSGDRRLGACHWRGPFFSGLLRQPKPKQQLAPEPTSTQLVVFEQAKQVIELGRVWCTC